MRPEIDQKGRDGPPWEANEAKRRAAIALVENMKAALAGAMTPDELSAHVSDICQRLIALQGGWRERRHFAKSVCQVATALRRAGWPSLALYAVDLAIARSATDGHVWTERAMSQIAMGDLSGALVTLKITRSHSVVGERIVSALIAAFIRRGETATAQALLRDAAADGVSSAPMYETIIETQLRQGDLQGSLSILALARETGQASKTMFMSVLRSCLLSSDVFIARRVLEEARLAQAADAGAYSLLIECMLKRGQIREAERWLRQATSAQCIDSRSCSRLIAAFGRRGAFHSARVAFAAAKRVGVADSAVYAAITRIGRLATHRRVVAARERVRSGAERKRC